MTVPLERDKELAVRQADVGIPVEEDRFPRKDTPAAPTQSDRALWLAGKLKEANIPLDLLLAIVKAESQFDPKAKSRVGALGLMQLMPGTAQQMNLKVEKGYDQRTTPLLNLNAGINYLMWLKQHFKPKSTEELLAAYNAGPSRLKGGKYRTYPETRAYIKKIRDQIARYKANPSERSADAQKLYNALMK
jgi:soluble lytic murein transglycosylase-like protein